MKRIHLLHGASYSRNEEALLFPLLLHRRRLHSVGIALSFFSRIAQKLFDCDVLFVSSKFFSTWWKIDEGRAIFDFLAMARKTAQKILWFDVSDSTGATQFRILPFVDVYCKNQILRDRKAYQKIYYGSRIFTDFYHTRFGVHDINSGEVHLNDIPTDDALKKIRVGWNYGMANYGPRGEFFEKIWHVVPFLPRWYPKRWWAPSATRSIALSCRMGTSYTRATVAFGRTEIRRLLQGRMPLHRVSRKEYFGELTHSIAALSPFGFGEICYRDFEIIICGAAMIKQDMQHCETWPNFWIAHETYLPLAWDFSDFEEKITYSIKHPKEMTAMAMRAQHLYKNLLLTEEGHDAFCDRFLSLF